MKPRDVLARAHAPDGTELTLVRHPSEWAILADGQSLMSSRTHRSEDALAALGCRRARTLAHPCVLIGGLGMGFTLRGALDLLPPTSVIIVAEFTPAVVEWNRGPLGALTQYPLNDPRVQVVVGDVAATIRSSHERFDAVLLDVDNGPVPLVSASSAHLYGDQGVAAARQSLTRGGVLAVWSVEDDRGFGRRLRRGGFCVQKEHVRTRLKRGGPRHTIFVAQEQVFSPTVDSGTTP